MKCIFALVSSLVLAFAPMPAAAAAGDLDTLNLGLVGTQVNAVAVQADGKLIIAGAFAQVLGTARGNIARLNADGTLDATFDPRTNGSVNAVAVQADGKVLLGGVFTSLEPNGAASATVRNNMARVNADGTLDTGFNVGFDGAVRAVAVQADGKILVGGGFFEVNGLWHPYLARVSAGGVHETGFQPYPSGEVHCLVVLSDGKILISGSFAFLAPVIGFGGTRLNVARVNADGSMDETFVNTRADGIVRRVAVQPDGKVLLGGEFTSLRPTPDAAATTRNRIARVNADGTLDTAFNPSANGAVSSLVVQADGKVLLGGEFTTLAPNGGAVVTRNRIARVGTDGTLDAAFNPNANGTVTTVVLQADGKMLLGGAFTLLTPNGGAAGTRQFFARLLGDPVSSPWGESFGELVYSGTFAGGGTLVRAGLPIVKSEAAGSIMERRALFIRRTDHAAAGLSYSVSFSANLSTWEVAAVVPTVLADNGTHQVVGVPFPAQVGGLEARFFKVSVGTVP